MADTTFTATAPTVTGYETAAYLFRLVDSVAGEVASTVVAGTGATVSASIVHFVPANSSFYMLCRVDGTFKNEALAGEQQSNSVNVDPRPEAPPAPASVTLGVA